MPTSDGATPIDPAPASGVRPETVAVTAGRPRREADGPFSTPVVFASALHAGGPVAYTRDTNPTWVAFEDAVGSLEGGSALSFASGMAAIAAVLETVVIGGRIVAPVDGYNGTRSLLTGAAPAGRWEVDLVDVTDTDAVIAACDGAALVFLESPTNPKNGIVDLEAVITAAHTVGTRVVVDNTYATPLLQRPLDLGADVVVHSATKLLSGHSDILMGVTVTRDDEFASVLRAHRTAYGAVPGPMESYLALRGLRTLALRVERGQSNAQLIAARLTGHPAITRVRYPGLPDDLGFDRAQRQMSGPGTMIAFETVGTADTADAVAASTQLIVHATSLGGIETTLERRARWRGEESTPPTLIRLSVGCEHPEDLWADLDQALKRATDPA